MRGRWNVTGGGLGGRGGNTWRMTRLNERLRFLRYERGMYFREHCDGCYVTPDGGEVSWLTVHVYLNGRGDGDGETGDGLGEEEEDGEGEGGKGPLVGGATRFFPDNLDPRRCLDVNPEVGACLVFQHRGLLHSGEEVESGVKYTVRSDIMYERVGGR